MSKPQILEVSSSFEGPTFFSIPCSTRSGLNKQAHMNFSYPLISFTEAKDAQGDDTQSSRLVIMPTFVSGDWKGDVGGTV